MASATTLPGDGGPASPVEDAAEPRTEAGAARLRELIDAHHSFIWRSLRRLGLQSADVDDATQRVFCVATGKLGAIRPGSERAFLYQIALRVASATRRSHGRRREVLVAEPEDRADLSPSTEELVALKRARVHLDAILDAMGIELRSVFTLFELERLPLSDIAELLGIPRGTVASRLRRARERFVELSQEFQE